MNTKKLSVPATAAAAALLVVVVLMAAATGPAVAQGTPPPAIQVKIKACHEKVPEAAQVVTKLFKTADLDKALEALGRKFASMRKGGEAAVKAFEDQFVGVARGLGVDPAKLEADMKACMEASR